MSDSTPGRPGVMGGPDLPADIMRGGQEPAGEGADVMKERAERPTDELEGGREPVADDPGLMEGGREPTGEDRDVMDSRDE